MKKYIAQMELKAETLSVEDATLPELKQTGLTKPNEILGETDLSQDHHHIIRWSWTDSVDKVINDHMTLTLNEDIQRTLAQFCIESIKSVEYSPTVVHVNF